MMKTLATSAIAAFITIAMLGSASACPNGYKAVWIQGNKVCQLDASASNKLKAKTKPAAKHSQSDLGQQLQLEMNNARHRRRVQHENEGFAY